MALYRNILSSTTYLTAALFCVAPMTALANPVGGSVSAGQAAISESGKTLDITQQSDKAVIDWRGFDVASDETTRFNQPSSSSLTLNRVNSNSASHIDGNVTANGNIVIVNQNGVMVGAGAKVDVNSLVVTTADTSNDAMMNSNGKLTFDKPGNPTASIVNNGTITAKEAGLVGFVAPNVVNNGVITAKLGRVQLASGDTATVDMYGDGLMEVAVSDQVKSQIVTNSGTIQADGGTIALTAAAGQHIVNSVITNKGSLQAQSVGMKNGEIVIAAMGSNAVANNVTANKGKKTGNSTVINSGHIMATGKASGEKGGTVEVTGDQIALLSGTVVDASGDAGGGTIRIGGDFHGKGITPTASKTIVQTDAQIIADALTTGNGGNVTVWADDRTQFEGTISAKGGNLSGDGGFVETSGHNVLGFNGFVDTTAAHGNVGTLLLDPTDITISTSANTGTMTFSGGQFADTTASSSNLNVTTLQNQLASSNVLVTTASGLGGTGNLTVSNPVTWSSAYSLTLFANNDLTVNAGITYTGSSANSLTLQANNDISVSGTLKATGTGKLDITLNSDRDASGAGAIVLNVGLTSNGGNITLGGGSGMISAGSGYAYGDAANYPGIWTNLISVNAGGGNIIANGRGYSAGSGTTQGIYVGGSFTTTGNGNITLNGIGGTSGSANGVQLGFGGVGSGTVTTANGNIVINGTGGVGSGSTSGVNIRGALSSTGGSITLTGIPGTGNGTNTGITTLGAYASIGNGNQTGNITFVTDTLSLVMPIQTTGMVTINPYTASTTIGVAGGSGNLAITNAILGNITASNIVIGNISDTGNLTANAYSSWASNLSLITGNGLITIAGAQAMGANNFMLQTDTTPTFSSTVTTTGTVSILPATASTSIGFSGGAGTLQITQAMMNAISAPTVTIGRSDATSGGTLTTAAYTWNSTLNTLNLYGYNEVIGGTLTSGNTSGTQDKNLNLYANNDIKVNSSSAISSSSTYGKMNILLDSDYDASGAGAISVSPNLTSNGGNITLGGGNGNITAGSGYAYGDSGTNLSGINLGAGATVSAGGGNIVMNGYGYAGGSNTTGANGIAINGATVQTTGNGTITLSGTGAGTGNGTGNTGININSAALLSVANGNLSLTGTGGATAGNNDDGISTAGTSIIQSTGNGTITLIGYGGGTGAGASNHGIAVASTITSQIGDITLTGTGGIGTGNGHVGIITSGNAVIASTGSANITLNAIKGAANGFVGFHPHSGTFSVGGASDTGNITLKTDSWNFAIAPTFQTAGSITIAPYTPSVSMGIAGTTPGNTLQLTDTILGYLNGGSYVFGSTVQTGNIALNAHTWTSPVSVISSSGVITIAGAQAMGANNFTIQSDVSPVLSSTITTTGAVTLKTTSVGTSVGFGGTAPTGTFQITQAMMNNIIAPTVTIGRSDSTGLLTTDVYAWNSANGLITLNIYGNNVTIGNTITKNVANIGNADANLNVYANGDITVNASSAISSSSTFGKLNILLDSDYDATNAGAITVNSGLTSNGGNITMQGGNATTHAAYGDAANPRGINIAAAVNAGGGNVIMNGIGYTGDYGVLLNGAVQTSGNGTITITGTGGAGGSASSVIGVFINANVSAVNGNILFTGTGGNSTGGNAIGIYDGAGTVQSTGNGTITLNGTGGANSASGHGITIASTITSQTGDISLTGSGGTTGGNGIYITTGNPSIVSTGSANITISAVGTGGNSGIATGASGTKPIGGSSDTGNITLITDTLGFSIIPTIQTTGTVWIKPYTANTSIGFSGGAGTLQITQAMMNNISAPTITIGRSDATSGGTLTSSAYSWNSTLTSLNLYGYNDVVGGTLTSGNTSGTQDKNLNVYANNDITVNSSSAISSSSTYGKLNILLDSDYDASGAGAIVVNSNLTSNGGNITLGGGANAATTAAVGDTASQYGVYVNAATLNAAGGTITITGTGYNSTGNNNYGVYLNSATLQTGGNGAIALTGTGTGNTASVGDDGVEIYASTIAATGNASISITGNSTMTGSGYANGIQLQGADHFSVVNGNMTLTGNSSTTAGTLAEKGIYINSISSILETTGTGMMSLSGTANGTGNTTNVYYGVSLAGTIRSTATGGGGIIINGTASSGPTGGSTYGVATGGNLSTVDGNISITGLNNSAVGGYNSGITTSGTIQATGNGSISLSGTGGGSNGSGANYGIWFQGGSNTITGNTGGVFIIGTAGYGTGGIGLKDAVTITATNGGAIALTGIAGTGYGIYSYNSGNAAIQTIGGSTYTGNITINTNSWALLNAPTIQTTGAGSISILPTTTGTAVTVGGSAADTTSYLNLTNTYLGYLNWGASGTLNIGSTDGTVTNATAGNITTGTSAFLGALTKKIAFASASGYDITLSNAISTSYAGAGNAITINSGRDLFLNAAITDAAAAGSGASNVFLSAYRNIISNASGIISVTNIAASGNITNSMGVVMDSNAANGTSGYILIGGNITTNGGNVTLGGGNLTAGLPTGYAIGGSGSGTQYGISIGAGINVGGGSIAMKGQGGTYANSGNITYNNGIYVSSTVQTSGNGTITLTGVGGSTAAGTNNYGVYITGTVQTSGTGLVSLTGTGGGNSASASNYGIAMYGTLGSTAASGGNITMLGTGGNGSGNSNLGVYVNGTVSSVDGSINITGNGSTTATGGANSGIGIGSAGLITATSAAAINLTGNGGGTGTSSSNNGIAISTGGNITGGSGAVTLIGTGGGGTGGSNNGISIKDIVTITATNGGAINLTGIAGSTSGDAIIFYNGGSAATQTIGGASYTGNMTLKANNVNFSNAPTIQTTGAGSISILPYTAGTAMVVGGTTTSSTQLNLTDTYLGYLNWGATGTLFIGSTDGTVANATAGTMTTGTSAVLGALTKKIAFATASGYDITLSNALSTSYTGAGNAISMISGGNVSLNAAITDTAAAGQGASNLFASAYSNIITNGNGVISVTNTGTVSNVTNSMAVVMDARAANGASGYISIGGNITTNGGNVTLGGGNITAGLPTGYAIGGSGNGTQYGVYLSAGTINAGGGNIAMKGQGGTYANSGNDALNEGINLASGTTVQTTGSGTITLTGTGGSTAAGNKNYGVGMFGTVQTSGSGLISVTGTGGGDSNSSANIGIVLNGYLRSTVASGSGGGGGITMLGTGGNGSSGGGSHGISLAGSTLSSVDGAINLTGNGSTASTGTLNFGINLNNNSITATGTGAITLTGTGGGTGAASSSNYGIALQAGTNISGNTNGVTINGTGGSGTSGPSHGVIVKDAITLTATNGGAIAINGVAGSASGSYGIDTYNSGNQTTQTIGGSSYTGNITLNTNSLASSNTVTIQTTGAGSISILPTTSGRAVTVGGSAADTNAYLNLTNTYLGYFNWGASGTFYIGSTDGTVAHATAGNITTGTSAVLGALTKKIAFATASGYDITLSNALSTSYTGAGNAISMISGGNVSLNAAITDTAAAGQGASNLFASAYSNIITNGNGVISVTNTGTVSNVTNSMAVVMDADAGPSSTSGYISIGAGIASNGGDIFMGGGNLSGGLPTGNAVGGSGNGTQYGFYQTAGNISASGGNITINALGGTYSSGSNFGIYITGGNITTSGNGTVNLTGKGGNVSGTDYGINITAGTITSGNGAITLTGTGGGASGNLNYGVYLSGASIAPTGTAPININGTAGSGTAFGVYLDTGETITSAGGTVTFKSPTSMRFDGSTNITYAAGKSFDLVIDVVSTGGTVGSLYFSTTNGLSTNGGNIYIGGGVLDGSGHPTGYALGQSLSGGGQHGIFLSSGTINAGGGNILMYGRGGTLSSNINVGIRLGGANLTTSGNGTITLNGTGGTISGSTGNYGIYQSAGTITSGSGAITINGTAGSLSSTAYGFYMTGGSIVSGSGPINVTGIGGGDTGAANYGIQVTGGTIAPTGNAPITLTGTAGSGTLWGIYYNLASATNVITSHGGTVTLASPTGIQFINANIKYAAGTSNDIVFDSATGGSSGEVYLNASNLSTNGGNIYIGGGALDVNGHPIGNAIGTSKQYAQYGVGVVSSTVDAGGGNIIMNGLGGTYASGTNQGTYLYAATVKTSGTGTIALTGTGGNVSTSNYGLYIYNGSSVYTTGSGALTLTGIGGSGASNYGIVTSTGTNVIGGTSDTGNITLKTNSISFDASTTIQTTGAGSISILPTTTGTAVTIGGSAADTTSYLNLTNTYLGYFNWGATGTLNIGSTDGSVANATAGNITTGTSTVLGALTKKISFATASGYDITLSNALSTSYAGSGYAVLANSGRDFFLNAGITDAAAVGSGASNVFLSANRSIISNSSGALSVTNTAASGNITNTAGLTIDADADANQDGYVSLGNGTFSTNGGNIVIGGGATPLSVAAYGDSNSGYGVYLNNTVMNAAGGSISMTGHGYAGGGDNNHGIYLHDASISTSGTGAIALAGTAGVGANSYGVYIDPTTITAASGAISVTGTTALEGTLTNNGTITLNNAVTLVGDATINAGNGTVAFGNVVNGLYNLTVSGGNITFAGALGGTAALNAVSLTAASALTLPAVNAASIFAQSATGNLTLSGVLSASGTGTAITLVSGSNFINNAGASALAAGNGRWLVYSTNPANDTIGGLSNDFRRFSCTYGGSCPTLGTGNGLLYSYTPTITVTPSAIAALTYGDAAPNLTGYSYGAITSGQYLSAADFAADTITGSLNGSTNYTQGSNVGSYNIARASGSLTSAMGYGFVYATNASAITVNARAITVAATTLGATYGDTMGTLAYTLTSGTLYGSDAFSGALTTAHGGAGTVLSHANGFDVGTPTGITQGSLIAGGNSGNNYAITYVGANLMLAAKGISIAGFAAANKTYDGTTDATISSNGSLSGTVSGDTVSINASGASATFDNQHASTTHTVTASGYVLSGSEAGNYSLSAQPTATNVTIDPKTLTVGLTGTVEKTYDGNTTVNSATTTITSSNYSLTGVVGGDTVSVNNTATGTYDTADAGIGKTVQMTALTLGGASASDYVLQSTTVLGSVGVIDAAALTVTGDTLSRDYGTSNPALTYSYSGLVGADTSSVFTGAVATTANADSNIGDYAITRGNLSAGNNYTITYTDGKLTVNRAALTVTVDDKAKTYGDADPAFTGTISGLTTHDASLVSASYAPVGYSGNAGTYTISPTYSDSSNRLNNYTISLTPGTFQVNASGVTLSIVADNNLTKIYGTANPALTFSYSGFVNGDTASILTGSLATLADINSNVGTYAITRGNLSAGTNYTISFTGANLTILPAPLTVTATVASKVYGQADPTFTGTITGLTAHDASLVSATFSPSGYSGNAGSYAISANFTDASNRLSNYTISTTPMNFTVNQATLNVSGISTSRTYGAANPTFSYSYSGFVNGDNSAVFSGTLNSVDATANVNHYDITQGTLSAGGNYNISYTPGTLTVNPAILTVNATGGLSRIYGDANPALTYTYSGFANSDNASLFTGALGSAATSSSNVGTYQINQGTLLAGGNYTIFYTGNTLTVTPRALSVTADNKTINYGDMDPALTFTYTGLVTGDTANFTGMLARASGTDIGTYSIGRGTLDIGGNYFIGAYNAGIFTIIGLPVNTNTAIPNTVTRVSQDPSLNMFGSFAMNTASWQTQTSAPAALNPIIYPVSTVISLAPTSGDTASDGDTINIAPKPTKTQQNGSACHVHGSSAPADCSQGREAE